MGIDVGQEVSLIGKAISIALLAITAAAAGFLYGVYTGKVSIPDRWNPWTPLDVRQPPGPLTGWKLWRVKHDADLCDTVLESTGMSVRAVPDSSTAQGCQLRNTVRVERSEAGFSSSFLASCPLAVGVALFDRQYLQAAARETYGQRVTRIEHVGSYACRNVNHAEDGSLSQHASANALDITGFVLEDGRRIAVARDWQGDSADALFLRLVHQGACKVFNGSLGPDFNALHASHFHVDMGPYGICR